MNGSSRRSLLLGEGNASGKAVPLSACVSQLSDMGAELLCHMSSVPWDPCASPPVNTAWAAFGWPVCSGSQREGWKKRIMWLKHVIQGPESLKEKSLLFFFF